MPVPNERRTAGLRSQRQGSAPEDTTPKQQRRAGPLSAVGSGNVEVAPGAGPQEGRRGERSARLFAGPMARFGGKAGGDAA
jgi:hypothetical protein